jgi:hypothetical protein
MHGANHPDWSHLNWTSTGGVGNHSDDDDIRDQP